MSGITHEWNGTILTITSDSGTSSCDLKGDKGDDGCRGAQGIPGKDGKGGGASIELDTTLTVEGAGADAKAVGEAIAEVNSKIDNLDIDVDVPVDSVNGKTGAVVLSATDVGALGLTGGELIGNLIIQKDSIPELRLRTDSTTNKYSRVFHNGDNGAYLQNADANGVSAIVVCNKAGLSGRLRFIDVAGTNSTIYYVLHTGNVNDYLPQTHYSTTQPSNWKNGDIWLKPAT